MASDCIWLLVYPEYVAFTNRSCNPDNPEDKQFMVSRSPFFHIDKIKSPLLIVHGGNDARVSIIQSRQIVDELRKKGKKVKYIYFDDEGHSIRKWNNMLHFLSQLESFLADHLGGRNAILEY